MFCACLNLTQVHTATCTLLICPLEGNEISQTVSEMIEQEVKVDSKLSSIHKEAEKADEEKSSSVSEYSEQEKEKEQSCRLDT